MREPYYKTVRNDEIFKATIFRRAVKKFYSKRQKIGLLPGNSFIFTISFIVTIVAAHIFADEYNKSLFKRKIYDVPESQQLCNLVSKYNNNDPLYHVLPILVVLIDDSKMFVFKGI